MASGKTLYIKGDRDVEVTKPDVTLADLLFYGVLRSVASSEA